MKQGEHEIQNAVRVALSGYGIFFRINVGQGWIGKSKRLPNGDVLLKYPRPFSTGAPMGFSDLFGVRSVLITPDMVGRTIGQAVFLEVKAENGRISDEQEHFLGMMKKKGCIAEVVRSADEAVQKVIEDEKAGS